jgi:CheY-like chemotaxis protein
MKPETCQVLLIDDDPLIHDAVTMILEPEGFTVTCCLTGPAGLAEMRRNRPGIVLLDIMLATVDEGFQLAYEMKRDEALKCIPIIVLSAIGAKTGMIFPDDAGSEYLPVERFLEKPIDALTLRTAVREVLERQGVAS